MGIPLNHPGNTVANRAKAALRRQRVLERILAGAKLVEVAAEVGCCIATVSKDWRRAVAERTDPADVKELRDRMTIRYNMLLEHWWPKAFYDLHAFDRVTSLMKEIRAFNGMDIKEPTPGSTPANPFYIAEVQEKELGTDKLSDKELFALDDHVRGEIEEILQRNGESPSGPGAA